jgi:hypothetical protein
MDPRAESGCKKGLDRPALYESAWRKTIPVSPMNATIAMDDATLRVKARSGLERTIIGKLTSALVSAASTAALPATTDEISPWPASVAAAATAEALDTSPPASVAA